MHNQSHNNDPANEGDGFSSQFQTAVDKMDQGVKAGKQKIAAVMDSGSDKLLAGVDAVENHALASAVKLSDGAKYLREASAKDVYADCCSLVEKYPFYAMASAALAGILIGKSLYNQPKRQS